MPSHVYPTASILDIGAPASQRVASIAKAAARFALALTAALATAPVAVAGPVVIANQYIRAGVSEYGTLGSGGSASPGIQLSPSGSGVFGSSDFLTPGAPFEGFYLTSSSGTAHANNDGTTSFGISSPTLVSATSATWSGTSGGFGVTNTYTATAVNNRPEIAILTTITNLSGSTMTGVKFLRTLDPDPDANLFYSTYATLNSVPDSSTVTARGPISGLSLSLFTTDTTFTHRAGVSSSWSTSPTEYLNGLFGGSSGDYSIGLAFDIGTIASGDSVSLSYGYASIATVPEPGSMTLAFAGVCCATVVVRWRYRKARSRA